MRLNRAVKGKVVFRFEPEMINIYELNNGNFGILKAGQHIDHLKVINSLETAVNAVNVLVSITDSFPLPPLSFSQEFFKDSERTHEIKAELSYWRACLATHIKNDPIMMTVKIEEAQEEIKRLELLQS